jgi:hypothetical protein
LVQQIRKHGASGHLPGGDDPLPWLGDYPYPGGATANQGINMVGPTANMPDPSLGTQSGSAGVVSGTTFTDTTAQFSSPDTGTTITISDNGVTPPVLYSFTVTYVSANQLTLSSAWLGTGSSDLSWSLTGRGASNAGLTYYATDMRDTPGGTLYQSTGTQWLPVASSGSSLPPWADWTDLFALTCSIGGTAPSTTCYYAQMMIQTENGSSWFPPNDPSAGIPLNLGTVLGQATAQFDDGGTPASSTATVLFAPLGLHDSSPSTGRSFTPNAAGDLSETKQVIVGYGQISQTSVDPNGPRFGFKIMANGQMYVDNTPDPFAPSGVQYLVRLANADISDPGFPFAIAEFDTISYAFTYPLILPD